MAINDAYVARTLDLWLAENIYKYNIFNFGVE